MVKMVPRGIFDQALGLDRDQLFLGLALELRVGHEHGQHHGGPAEHIVAGYFGRLLVLYKLGVSPQALGQGRAKPAFVGDLPTFPWPI